MLTWSVWRIMMQSCPFLPHGARVPLQLSCGTTATLFLNFAMLVSGGSRCDGGSGALSPALIIDGSDGLTEVTYEGVV